MLLCLNMTQVDMSTFDILTCLKTLTTLRYRNGTCYILNRKKSHEKKKALKYIFKICI